VLNVYIKHDFVQTSLPEHSDTGTEPTDRSMWTTSGHKWTVTDVILLNCCTGNHAYAKLVTYRVRHKKVTPVDLLAVFSATAGNFNAKFYILVYSPRRYQQHLIVSQTHWRCSNATYSD